MAMIVLLLLNLLIRGDYSPENIALDKLPVEDDKGILTFRLLSSSKEPFSHQMFNEKLRTAMQEITRTLNFVV